MSNNYRIGKIEQSIRDNKGYADLSNENIVDYLIRDFDASPEGWDGVFRIPYDSLSAEVQIERRNVLKYALEESVKRNKEPEEKEDGTITWYPVSKLPPKHIKNDFGWYSDDLLITNGYAIEKADYSFSGEAWCTNRFTPTHWAFINYPE